MRVSVVMIKFSHDLTFKSGVIMNTPEEMNLRGAHNLPGHLGMVFTEISTIEVRAEMPFKTELLAPNGYLHAGSLVALADTACGYGCMASLPTGASGFTTIELKSNHLGTALSGTIDCVAKPAHRGKTTQVWDATLSHRETGKTLALFRCTQMVLYPKPAS